MDLMQATKKRWKAGSVAQRRLAVVGSGLVLAAGGVAASSAHADTTNCTPGYGGIACWKVTTPSGFVQLTQINSKWDVIGTGNIPNGECVWLDLSQDGGNTWQGWKASDCDTHSPYMSNTGSVYDGVGYLARACTYEPTNSEYYCTNWH